MKLRNRLLFIAAAPMLAVLGFISFVMFQQIQERGDQKQIVTTFGYAKVMSGLINELQKERGFSAGHVGSRGVIFAPELRTQRGDTDAVIQTTAETFAHLEALGETEILEVKARLVQLNEIRGSIDELSLTVPELARFYTGTINMLIAFVEADISTIRDGEIAQMARSFFAILSAKESAGLERALGAVGFGSGAFKPEIFERYISLFAAQNTLIDQAMRVADAAVVEMGNGLLSSPERSAIGALRQNAHELAWGLGEVTTTGPEWFKTSTAWVDRLKQTEDGIFARAVALAEEKVAAGETTILLEIAFSAVALTASLGVALLVSSNLGKGVGYVLGLLRDISKDRLDVEVKRTEGTDEIADFARMAQIFKDNAIERNAADAAAKAAREEVEQALADVKAAKEAQEAERATARKERLEREKVEKDQAAKQAALVAEKHEAEQKQAEAERQQAEATTRAAKERQEADEAQAGRLAHVVRSIRDGLSRLSNGDFQTELVEPFDEEYESLRTDFNMAQTQLRALVGDVISGSTSLAQSALELKSASQDLASRTERQAATLEQGAATAKDVSGIVDKTTEDLEQTVRSANDAKSRAEQGGGVVREAITAMDGISNSSQAISQIIAVIDDIAFQTNLLSLNAGVEAARAGEAGRGFAVVATEVRSLAERASSSAKEIKDLIVDSTRQVKTGVSLVNRTGEALDEIVRDVSQISTTIEDITSSSQRQSDAMSSLSESIAELDAATQNNAAMAQEMTAAAVNLSDETARVVASATIFEGAAPAEADEKRAA